MNLLLYGPVNPEAEAPDFGEAFRLHMEQKTHSQVVAASKSAWSLLAKGLKSMNISPLPRVAFLENGKPYFADSPLHFSISHSGSMAAALISDAPCGVDIERIRDEVSLRMVDRCMNDAERRSGCDFFEIWTKKECIAKLDGSGMVARPKEINTLDPEYKGKFSCMRIENSTGEMYALSILCRDAGTLRIII